MTHEAPWFNAFKLVKFIFVLSATRAKLPCQCAHASSRRDELHDGRCSLCAQGRLFFNVIVLISYFTCLQLRYLDKYIQMFRNIQMPFFHNKFKCFMVEHAVNINTTLSHNR